MIDMEHGRNEGDSEVFRKQFQFFLHGRFSQSGSMESFEQLFLKHTTVYDTIECEFGWSLALLENTNM